MVPILRRVQPPTETGEALLSSSSRSDDNLRQIKTAKKNGDTLGFLV